MGGAERPNLAQLALLARLKIEESEREALEVQLAGILAAFGALQDVDTDGIEPSPYPIALESVLREDGPIAGAAQELPRGTTLLDRHAPLREDDGYRVPPILE